MLECIEEDTVSRLENLFVDCAIALSDLMKKWAEVDGLKKCFIPYIDFSDDGHFYIKVKESYDYRFLFVNNYKKNEIWKIDTINQCLKEHFNCKIFHSQKPNKNGIFYSKELTELSEDPLASEKNLIYLTSDMLFPIWKHFFEEFNTLDVNESEIRKIHQLWSSPKLICNIEVPLLHFDCDADYIKLGDIELSLFTVDDKKRLLSIHSFLSGYSMVKLSDVSKAKFKLNAKIELNRIGFNKELSDFKRGILLFITALRLFQPGFMSIGGIHSSVDARQKTPGYSQALGMTSYYDYCNVPLYVKLLPGYKLLEKDTSLVEEIFDDLVKTLQCGIMEEFQLAIDRLHSAYTREHIEDRIIDLTIALESCLLWGTKDELSYRLSLRGATLLADIRDTQETKVLLNAMYNIRSQIVHNGQRLKTAKKDLKKELGKIVPSLSTQEVWKNPKRLSENLRELSSKCKDIVRDILRQYLKRLAAGDKPDNIIANLDDELVKALTHKHRKTEESVFSDL